MTPPSYAVLMFFLAAAGSLHTKSSASACSPKVEARVAGSILVAAANLLSLALSQSRGALMALGTGLV